MLLWKLVQRDHCKKKKTKNKTKQKKQRDSNKVWSIFIVVSDCRKILVDYRAMRIKLMWI